MNSGSVLAGTDGFAPKRSVRRRGARQRLPPDARMCGVEVSWMPQGQRVGRVTVQSDRTNAAAEESSAHPPGQLCMRLPQFRIDVEGYTAVLGAITSQTA